MSEPPRRSKRAHPAAETELIGVAQDPDEEAALKADVEKQKADKKKKKEGGE